MQSRDQPEPSKPGPRSPPLRPWDDKRLRETSSLCAETLLNRLDEEEPLEKGPADLDVEEKSTLHGELSCFPISGLLQFLAANLKTGILRVRAPQRRFTLVLREGEVVHAVCEPREFHEHLGSILLDRGSTSPQDLARLIRMCETEKRKLGQLLTHEGIVSPLELRRALEYQVQLLFHRLLASTEGDFEFVEFDPPLPPNHVQLGVMKLLLESARSQDERK